MMTMLLPTPSRPMKSIPLLLFLTLALRLTAASNTTLYQTSFEAPAFTPGSPLRGQDNWEMYHDGEAISVVTNNARTGAQCLRMEGALLEQVGPNFATAYGFSRALDAFSNNPPAIVEITASVRLDGPQTGTNGTPDLDILSANLMAVVPRADGQGQSLGGFYVSSAGKIYTYSPEPADNYKFSVPYVFGTYRTLRLRVDFVARSLGYFIDDVALGTVTFPSSITADRLISGYISLNGPLEPIDTPELTYHLEDYTAYFDDYSLVSIPLSPVNAVIEFASTNILTDEFEPSVKIRLTRRGFTNAAVRVKVHTTNGTGIAGEDYDAVSSLVTFAAGETNKVFEVPLRDDSLAEPDRTFAVLIAELPPGVTSGKPQATVLIRDDERPGSIDYSWSTTFGLPALRAGERKYAYPTVFDGLMSQPDGKLIVPFVFESPDAQGLPQSQYFRLVRLHRDGSLDPSFSSHQTSRYMEAFVLADGKILTAVDQYPNGFRVSRRNTDGTLDASYTTRITNITVRFQNLSDGRIVAYGEAISVDGQAPRNVLRLDKNMTLDSTFSAPTNIAIQEVWQVGRGQLLVFGYPRPKGVFGIQRLNADGTLDTNFNTGTGLQGTGAGLSDIRAVIEQADGKLILSGYFQKFNGETRNSIVRLHPNGSIDESFASGQGFTVREYTGTRGPSTVELHALPEGAILASGEFDQFDGKPVRGPIVLHPDGTRDFAFEGTVAVYDNFYGDSLNVVGILDGQPIVSTLYGLGRLRMDLPLRIISHTHEPAGTSHLLANALPDRIYTLQATENLSDWVDLTTQLATTNRVEFTDTPAPSLPRRMYRVKQN